MACLDGRPSFWVLDPHSSATARLRQSFTIFSGTFFLALPSSTRSASVRLSRLPWYIVGSEEPTGQQPGLGSIAGSPGAGAPSPRCRGCLVRQALRFFHACSGGWGACSPPVHLPVGVLAATTCCACGPLRLDTPEPGAEPPVYTVRTPPEGGLSEYLPRVPVPTRRNPVTSPLTEGPLLDRMALQETLRSHVTPYLPMKGLRSPEGEGVGCRERSSPWRSPTPVLTVNMASGHFLG